MHRLVRVVAVFAFSLGLVSTARAAPFTNVTGLVSPTSVVTFDEIVLVNGQAIDDEFTPYGVTFSPNLYFSAGNGGCYPGACSGMDGQILVNFGPNLVTDFTMTFGSVVHAAAFAAIDNRRQFLLQALLDGALVEETQLALADFPGQGFVGFEGIAFNGIRVVSLNGGSFGMDNLQLAAVPEPITLLLLGTGLAGIGVRRWRKRTL